MLLFCFLINFLAFLDIDQPGRHWVTAQSLTEPEVYSPDKELSVDRCGSAILQCCIFDYRKGEIVWFKQQNRKPPVFIAGPFNPAGEMLYSEFQNSRFQVEKSKENCFILTISNTTLSDEATYYCTLMFSAKTYLKIKGTSTPALCDHSSTSEPTLHGNSIHTDTQDKTVSEMIRSLQWTVTGLGTALGLSTVLIFCLIYFMLRKRKCESCKLKTSTENSTGTRQVHVQDNKDETLNYAALKFSKQKPKAEKRKTFSSVEFVYSVVNYQ
ncbi:uncharacterized protein LOC131357872 isoform X1 [Hemibagrus wyckioides]|uniref:uncharacterized protein LOC131357872 isoform X1 n=1 Tax=Hemibagrus wyckioides TaxID=337641 RepID=UPI00266C3CDE|nr:uncharacterized protein LOC131357872 isoform X1 [Hemibagrus wyckioides]